MTLQKSTIFILVLVAFGCQLSSPNDETPLAEADYCKNIHTLISNSQSDVKLDIDFGRSFQSNLELIRSSMPLDTCLHSNYFIITIPTKTSPQRIDVRVRFIEHCDDCILGCPTSSENPFEIIINQRGKMLVDERLGDTDSIEKWLPEYYRQEWNDRRFFYVGILWDEAVDENLLNASILAVVKGYLRAQKQFVLNEYGKAICDLSSAEVAAVGREFPFILELAFGEEGRFSVIPTHG